MCLSMVTYTSFQV